MTDKIKKTQKTKVKHNMELLSVAKSICIGFSLMHVAVLKKLCLSSKKQFLSRGKQKLTYETQRIVREHSVFRRWGWAGGIPKSMNVKSLSPPFKFFVKKM